MAKLTSKRRGRPPSTLPDDRINRQAEGDNAASDGNRDAGGTRTTAQTDISGEGQRNSWLGLKKAVIEEKSTVATAWHPIAREAIIGTNNSDVRVLVGESAYQLSTGEMIKL
jgi:hypothetical protein